MLMHTRSLLHHPTVTRSSSKSTQKSSCARRSSPPICHDIPAAPMACAEGTAQVANDAVAPTDGSSIRLRVPTEQAADPTLLATRVPPPPEACDLGARVEHLTPHREGLLAEVVAEQLGLPLWFVEELLDFGAVYHCAVHPPPPAGAPLTEAMRARMAEARELALEEHAGSKHQQLTKLSQPQRVARRDLAVRRGSYIRVHVHPKRFPAFYDVDWKARVLHDGPGYVVVDKPAGVQVVPRVDNAVECVLSAVGEALGLPDPLLPAHRLDCWTEGVLVLGKDPAFVARFSEALRGGNGGGGSGSRKDNRREKKKMALAATSGSDAGRSSNGDVEGGKSESGSECTRSGEQQQRQQQQQQQAGAEPRALAKVYRALSREGPVPLGAHVHHAWVNVKLRGLPAFTHIVGAAAGELPLAANEFEGQVAGDAVRCELHVLSCRRVTLGPAAAARFGVAAAWESEVLLVTGRTHQIRAQLAALGCPLLGDDLYGGGGPAAAMMAARVPVVAAAQPGVAAGGLQQQQQQQQQQQRPAPPQAARGLNPPEAPLGLQAARLEVLGDGCGMGPSPPYVFEAGPPWWRR